MMAFEQTKTVPFQSAGNFPVQGFKMQTSLSAPSVSVLPAVLDIPITLEILQQMINQSFMDYEQRMELRIASRINEKLCIIEEDMEEIKGDLNSNNYTNGEVSQGLFKKFVNLGNEEDITLESEDEAKSKQFFQNKGKMETVWNMTQRNFQREELKEDELKFEENLKVKSTEVTESVSLQRELLRVIVIHLVGLQQKDLTQTDEDRWQRSGQLNLEEKVEFYSDKWCFYSCGLFKEIKIFGIWKKRKKLDKG